jgi:hypothetical protein
MRRKVQQATLGFMQVGLDLVTSAIFYWLFVVIFIISFSIGLQFRADDFQIPQQRKALTVVSCNFSRHSKYSIKI